MNGISTNKKSAMFVPVFDFFPGFEQKCVFICVCEFLDKMSHPPDGWTYPDTDSAEV